MRSFRFTARNLGRERYLTYIMGEGMELDEDVLDFCEENDVSEIVNIIYEEDDDYDYLTYDVTDMTSISKYSQGVMDREKVLNIIRNVSLAMINIKEQALPLSYIMLNRDFMYIDPETMQIRFLYLPVESDSSLSVEFKGFVRQLVASFIYNVDEDLSYVGQLLTYINGNGFNLRGLIGLAEALMQDAGIGYGGESDIESDDGTEVVSDIPMDDMASEKSAMDFMNDLGAADEKLPEIGDDEDSEIELSDAEPANEPEPVNESAEPSESSDSSETSDAKDADEKLKEKIKNMIEEENAADGVSMSKPVKVNRAAMLKAAAEKEEEKAASEAIEELSEESKNAAEKDTTTIEETPAAKETPKSTPIVENTILGSAGVIKINPYIVRVNTNEKVMINKPVFKIGKASRGVDYHISGNGAISRQHAVILHKGDSYFIKDNKSTNHTYVDHVQIEGDEEVQLKNNCTITLGDEDFTFKIS